MLFSVMEHGMMSFEFSNLPYRRTKQSSFVKFENENGVISYSITEQSTSIYVLF